MGTIRISFILVFLISCAIVNAQKMPKTLGYVKMAFLNLPTSKKYLNNGQPKNVGINLQMIDSSKIKFSPNSISSTYYTEHLGMMCKEELKLEKAIKFPVRIRLGSKEQVDYLEGKFNSH